MNDVTVWLSFLILAQYMEIEMFPNPMHAPVYDRPAAASLFIPHCMILLQRTHQARLCGMATF